MLHKDDREELWDKEYGKQGIPSSFRAKPSGAVEFFLPYLKKSRAKRIIDIGCGTGRNTIFLAGKGYEVSSMDLSHKMIQGLKKKAKESGLSEMVHAHAQNVGAVWRLKSAGFDGAIDTFCYKHLIRKGEQEKYQSELHRVLKPGGHYLLSLADRKDSYYGGLPKKQLYGSKCVIRDPANGILSVLYSKKEILGQFSGEFDLIGYEFRVHANTMHDKEYKKRITHFFVFRRR